MIKYTAKDMKNLLSKELREYEAMIGYMTSEEKIELSKWVSTGNQAICNPYYLYGENGNPMDYIAAYRIVEDMTCHPEDYNVGLDHSQCEDSADEEQPF